MKRSEIFSSIRTKLPPSNRNSQTTHAGLWLDKYIQNHEREDTTSRRKLIAEVTALPEPEIYKTFYEDWKKRLKEFGTQTREAQVKGRMIVGLGSESVLETSITLHHTYGVPYIPGSALKGLAANYAHKRLGDTWKKDSLAYNAVFGNTDNAGYITFFDALYIPGSGHKGQVLYSDVITVHHQKYYQEDNNASPSDWDSPNPVPFLSATGKYLIALAAPDIKEDNRDEWLKKVFEILGHALKDMGIGAKTSSGYGRMELEQKIDLDLPDIQEALRLKEEINGLSKADVSRRMQPSYFPRWRDMPSKEARRIVANAIVEKVRNVGLEETMSKQGWYKYLQSSLN